nr:immunoglobulin light chain junction region [Macaca mulatta]MOW53928.1 immunoglobulin light chain junction region [Macaca mulatta]MOW55617.1 immunoglobulin light chain junction region [Macaca mulatta]
CLQDIQLPYSF